LEKLKELRINDNKVLSIESSIAANLGLEILDLGKNQIIKGVHHLIQLKRLKSINLL